MAKFAAATLEPFITGMYGVPVIAIIPLLILWFGIGQQLAAVDRGLGFLLASNANQFNSAGTFAAVVVLAAITFVIDRVMFVITRRALMWKETGHHS